MTKAEFIDQVVKTSEEMDLTKKAAGELIDSIFGIVGTAITKDGRFSWFRDIHDEETGSSQGSQPAHRH